MSWAEQNRLLAMSKNGRRASLFLLCKGDAIASQFILESSSVVSLSSTVSLRTLLVLTIGEVLHAWLCTLILPFMLVLSSKSQRSFLFRTFPDQKLTWDKNIIYYQFITLVHMIPFLHIWFDKTSGGSRYDYGLWLQIWIWFACSCLEQIRYSSWTFFFCHA